MITFPKLNAVAAAIAVAFAGAAHADLAETKGGLKIKTEDGNFEASVGGRIHFDMYVPVDDDDVGDLTGQTNFRRARLTIEGKAYRWKYKFECDFTGSGSGCFREMWLGTALGPANVRVGQAKPYRGMEELTSSNEILFMERPFATASGIYAGNQFAQGIFLDGHGANWTWGFSGYSLRSEAAPATEGVGAAVRGTFAPVANDSTVIHLGLTASTDHPQSDVTSGTPPSPTGPSVVDAAGRAYGRITGSTLIARGLDERTGFGGELALRSGPIYAQSEYAMFDFTTDGSPDESVDAYYVQASWLLTGEVKPYDAKKGVFKSPKPNSDGGAWELKARYDVMEGESTPNDKISTVTTGLNWYVNPNVRFMLEYLNGSVEQTTDADVSVVQLRSQFNF